MSTVEASYSNSSSQWLVRLHRYAVRTRFGHIANVRSAQNRRTRLSIIRTRRLTAMGSSSCASIAHLIQRSRSIALNTNAFNLNSIKKPKTNRYPSLKGTDPKFRRNHRHALHGTMKALVRCPDDPGTLLARFHAQLLISIAEGGQGGKEGRGIEGKRVGVSIGWWIQHGSFDDFTARRGSMHEHIFLHLSIFPVVDTL